MITDPHYVPYGNLNLNGDFWRQCQRDQRAQQLSNRLIELFSEELTAVVSKLLLEELGFDIACECCMDYTEIITTTMWHFYSISLCIMSHGKYEEEIDKVRFSKSEHLGKAYLSENIKKVDDPTCRWGKNVLKDDKPLIIAKVPIQRSLF